PRHHDAVIASEVWVVRTRQHRGRGSVWTDHLDLGESIAIDGVGDQVANAVVGKVSEGHGLEVSDAEYPCVHFEELVEWRPLVEGRFRSLMVFCEPRGQTATRGHRMCRMDAAARARHAPEDFREHAGSGRRTFPIE